MAAACALACSAAVSAFEASNAWFAFAKSWAAFSAAACAFACSAAVAALAFSNAWFAFAKSWAAFSAAACALACSAEVTAFDFSLTSASICSFNFFIWLTWEISVDVGDEPPFDPQADTPSERRIDIATLLYNFFDIKYPY